MDEKKTFDKILVIGSTIPNKNIVCYKWNEIESIPNPSDHDAIIINTTTLNKDILKDTAYINPKYFNIKYLDRLFSSGGKLFIIVAPVFNISISAKEHLSNYWWCPNLVTVKNECYDPINVTLEAFQKYFSYIKKCFTTIDKNIHLPFTIIAKGRSQSILSCNISHPSGGNIYFLPPTTEIAIDEYIKILLMNFLGISSEI